MPYVEDYTEHEYGDVHFDESQESNGDGHENFDDGSYGDDNEVNGDYQQHGSMNGHHEPNGNQNNGDDGARWPHADKSNADLDMLVDYVMSKAIELGVVSDGEADDSDERNDLGDHDDYERDTSNSGEYGDNDGGDMGEYQNDEGDEARCR
ncbi:hypothetical protein CLAIMM_09156 [Cladophialophora immunda]|nr:hypothetical protein CLAIMM_09156 [Cladophialophora immunda]